MAIPYPPKGDPNRNHIENPGQEGGLIEGNKTTARLELEKQLSNPDLSEKQADAIKEHLNNLDGGLATVIPASQLGSTSLETKIGNTLDSKDLNPEDMLARMVNMDGSFNPYEYTEQIKEIKKKHQNNNN